jgi:hypothetical protein
MGLIQVVRLDLKARPDNLFSTRDTPHNQRHTQTKRKRLENYLPGMWKPRASRNSYSHFIKKGHFFLFKIKIATWGVSL